MSEIIKQILIGVAAGLILYFGFGIGREKKRYASVQYIKILPPSLGGVDHIDLDDIAVLKLHAPSNMDRISFLLIDKPIVDWSYSQNGIEVEGLNAMTHDNDKIYAFSVLDCERKIKIKGRQFVVTLKRISKLNVKSVPAAIQYEFGVKER